MPTNHTPPHGGPRTCPQCGGPMPARNAHYCSRACRDAAARLATRRCLNCGTAFQPDLSRRRYCSAKCAAVFTGPQRRHATRPKPCAWCGARIERRQNEKPAEFRKRKTCSPECQYQLIAAPQRLPETTKPCAVCGAVMTKRDGESATQFKKRKTCSTACKQRASAHGRRRQTPPKTCVICGKTFTRRANELPCDFADRQCCSRACGYRLTGQTQTGESGRRSPYPVVFGAALKAAIRERDGQRCRLCGGERGTYNLHIHHINYDKRDCRPENLISLCASCHGKTHTDRPYWESLFTRMMSGEP